MNETSTNDSACVAAIANGPNGEVAIKYGAIVILGGLILVGFLVTTGHTVAYSGPLGTLKFA